MTTSMPGTSIFAHVPQDRTPTLEDLAERHSALFQLMHRDTSPETLREIARQLTVLAGWYNARADNQAVPSLPVDFVPEIHDHSDPHGYGQPFRK